MMLFLKINGANRQTPSRAPIPADLPAQEGPREPLLLAVTLRPDYGLSAHTPCSHQSSIMDGVSPAIWVGLKNYLTIFQFPFDRTIYNAFLLVVWFSFIPVGLVSLSRA